VLDRFLTSFSFFPFTVSSFFAPFLFFVVVDLFGFDIYFCVVALYAVEIGKLSQTDGASMQ